jgi:hypothetical protein
MPNPQIWNTAAAAPPQLPPRHRAIWIVYSLRDQGEKLPAEAVMRTAKMGLLEFWRSTMKPDALNARLTDAAGYPVIGNLSDVVVLRGPPGGGLLLHGTQLSTRAGQVMDIPQAWWCVVHSLQPLPEPPIQ